MQVLVTGGLGHLGSWICHDLLSKGKKVLVTGHSKRYLSYLAEYEENIEFRRMDVLDFASICRLLKEKQGQLEGIIHIAGLMGGPFFATNPHYHIQVNTMGTVNFLEASRIFGLNRFVYISSGSIYGPRDDVPLESDPLTPGDLYSAAKSSCEFFGLQYANEFGLDFRALRVYFAYGPGRMPSELYPLYGAVFGSLEGNTRVELPAGADQSLDFTYVKDIALATRLVFEAEQLEHRQYNVTSGVYQPIPELIETVARLAGLTVETDIGPGRIMPRGPSLDHSRLRDELGYSPQYTFEQGVAEYASWMKQLAG
ncbi:MAG: NAD(P)-dependent oxidoreductase [Desulfobacteraceae bacterium]|nr:MAG: NAD(P)-dependent oxidoreductase [Desulfobacteraceae bacterium]